MASQAKKRNAKVIDPKKITDSFLWADAYKSGYRNIQFGDNGELLVLNTDLTGTEKTIPHKLGYDSTIVLSSTKELRAPVSSVYVKAIAKQDELDKQISVNTKEALESFLETEHTLLETASQWESELDTSKRRNLAFQMGEHTKALQLADENLRKAMYPRRYNIDYEIERKMVNPESRDERKMLINAVVLQRTDPSMREFTVTDKA